MDVVAEMKVRRVLVVRRYGGCEMWRITSVPKRLKVFGWVVRVERIRPMRAPKSLESVEFAARLRAQLEEHARPRGHYVWLPLFTPRGRVAHLLLGKPHCAVHPSRKAAMRAVVAQRKQRRQLRRHRNYGWVE